MNRQEIWKMIDARTEDLLKLCSDMIAIPSVNPPGDVSRIVDYITNYLKEHKIPFDIVGENEDRPNILARYGTPGNKTVVFNGHCDVVPVGDENKWAFPPFSGEIKDGVMLGRGTSDMKCGMGAFLFAVAMLADAGVKLSGDVLMTIVPDEETGGAYGTQWLFNHGYIKGDWGIVAEPTGMDNIEVGQKGTMGMNLYATGTTAHGSLTPYVGDNAIDKLVKILPMMYELREIHGNYDGEIAKVMEISKEKAKAVQKTPGVENIMDHVTVNFGTIQGGVKRNVVADTAMAELDVRVPIGVSHEEVMAKVDEIIKKSGLTGITATYDNPRGGNYVSVNDPIVATVKECIKELLGIDMITAYQWASSDTRYFREAGISTIQYGPSNTEGIHNYNETVNVADIITASKVYAAIILSLVG
ncbi:MAG: ArgE/DapE family deacylase [Clostridiales bacterium]|nr:ArgE/DapE family deacylase [Clostridiales bacterium]